MMRLSLMSLCVCLSALAQAGHEVEGKPNWSRLDKYAGTIGRADFERLLTEVFVPREGWRKNWIELNQKVVRIRKEAGKDEWYVLPFAKDQAAAKVNRPDE